MSINILSANVIQISIESSRKDNIEDIKKKTEIAVDKDMIILFFFNYYF